MASKTTRHTLSMNLVGNIKEKLEGIADAAQRVEADMNKGIGTSAKYAAALSAATLVFNKVVEAVKEGTQAYLDIDAAQGRLVDSLKRVNAAAGMNEKANTLAAIAAKKYGIQLDKSLDSIRRMVDATGDASTALNDYSLAVNIAQKEDKDLAEITELLSNVRKGEIGELKKLNGVNQDTIVQLTKITNATDRGRAAIEKVIPIYEGAAEATRGAADAMKAKEEQMRLMKASAADVAFAFGEIIGVLKVNDEITWFDKFAHGMRVWAKELRSTDDAASDFYDSITELTASEAWDVLSEWASMGMNDPNRQDLLPMLISAGDDKLARLKGRRGSRQAGKAPGRDVMEGGSYSERSSTAGDFKQISDISESDLAEFEAKQRKGKQARKKEKDDVLADMSSMFDDVMAETDREHGEWEKRIKDHEKRKEQLEVKAFQHKQAFEKKKQEILAQMRKDADEDELKQLEAKEKAQQRVWDASLASASAAEGIAGMFIESEAAKASIRAAMEVAEGIAALAAPFGAGVPSAIQHFAAATQFGIAAAMGGKSAPGKKGGSAGGGAPTAARTANTERLNATERQPVNTTINLDFSRSVGVGPQAAKEIATEAARGMSLSSGNVRVF